MYAGQSKVVEGTTGLHASAGHDLAGPCLAPATPLPERAPLPARMAAGRPGKNALILSVS